MRGILLIGTAALALAACQKAPSAGSDQAAATAPASAPLGGPPHRRAGLWEQTFSRDGKPMDMGGMKICVDDAMEAKAAMFKSVGPMGQPGEGTNCTHNAPSRGLDGSWTFSATCKTPDGMQVTSSGKISGDFNSAYHMEMTSDTSGASFAPMNGHHTMQADGKWLGPCPAGMAGGDMQMANGMTISTSKLGGAAKALGGMVAGHGAPGQ
jgi:hypothetical protein